MSKKSGVQFSNNVDVQIEEDPYSDEEDFSEMNQFKKLCDGVLNSLALVHASMQEYLVFKDEIIKHSLPPNVLLKVSLVSGKLYRSMSDLNMPLMELIRMVNVYSMPWNEKSAALKKLHEDYEKKSTQLNVALRQLSLQDTEAKRVNRERKMNNWERLFCKIQMKRGHGRRWKFKMHDFRVKAEAGIENLREYFHMGEGNEDSDEEAYDAVLKVRGIEKKEDATVESSEPDESESQSQAQESETAEEPTESRMLEDVIDEDEMIIDSDIEFESPESPISENEKVFLKDSPIPPETVETEDKAVSTGDASFEHFLHVRLYLPKGVDDVRGVKYQMAFANKAYKTRVLDAVEEEEEIEEVIEPEEKKEEAKSKGRLIGKKKVTIEDESEKIKREQLEKKKKGLARYEEFVLDIPDWLIAGSATDPAYEQLQITLLANGEAEEMVAMTTVDMEDIQSLEIPSVRLPADTGDDPELGEEDTFRSVSLPGSPIGEPHGDLEPTPFPLYPVSGGKGPTGNLPISFFWAKRQRHWHKHRLVETGHIYDLVEELTGIDLNRTTLEELTREKIDEALSPRPQTPVIVEETVSKDEMDDMMLQHSSKIALMQEDYERRLAEMNDSVAAANEAERTAIEAAKAAAVRSPRTPKQELADRGVSPAFHFTLPSSTADLVPADNQGQVEGQIIDQPPVQMQPKLVKKVKLDKLEKPKKNFRIGKPNPKWGEGLPPNFLDRLEIFTNLSTQHREELSDRMRAEIAAVVERQLAEAYKLNKKNEMMMDSQSAIEEVSLPAVFMPTGARNPAGVVYNARAHQYFHPTGVKALRLSQPPSMLSLPTLSNRVAMLSLFDLSQQPPQLVPGGPGYPGAAARSAPQNRAPPPTLAPPGGPTQTTFVLEDN